MVEERKRQEQVEMCHLRSVTSAGWPLIHSDPFNTLSLSHSIKRNPDTEDISGTVSSGSGLSVFSPEDIGPNEELQCV